MNFQESSSIKFKQIWKDKYLKTIMAFADVDGETLYKRIGSTKSRYWKVK